MSHPTVPTVDWDGACARHDDLSDLLAHLARLPMPGSLQVTAEIMKELAAIPHPNWIRPHVVVIDPPKES